MVWVDTKKYLSFFGQIRLIATWIVLVGMNTSSLASDFATMESAMIAFEKGEFLEASEIGKNLGTYEGLTLAANALIIHGEHVALKSQGKKLFLEAIALSEQAENLDPNRIDAIIAHMRALGRYTEGLPSGEALSGGYGNKLKDFLEKILRINPNSWEGHLGFGAWHAKIIKKGGLPGRLMFGASERKALEHFNKSLAINPNSIVLNFEVAKALKEFNSQKYKSQILKLLQKVLTSSPSDEYENILIQEANDLIIEVS